MNLLLYKSILFDCDGILLESNKIKTNAFAETVKEYGEDAVFEMCKYHTERGGISRYKKFEYFQKNICSKLKLDIKEIKVESLVKKYAEIVYEKLSNCKIEDEIIKYRSISNADWYIVSGSDQEELNRVLKKRNIDKVFNGGIFGSPRTKEVIFRNLIDTKKIKRENSIYIGDSKYDHVSARKVGIDFIFIKKWSEFNNISKYAYSNDIKIYQEFKDIID